jgi:hypothetical protein
MAELTFINSLNDEQAAYALKVAQKAEQMGIPKTLALGIVMNESGFNPKVPDSKAGAIGLMQVMPKTGKSLGYTVDQLRDEDANIEAGLKALKENLDRTKGDWLLSAALYNAGDVSLNNTNVAQKGIPAETQDYVRKLQSYGVFNTADEGNAEAPAEESAAPPAGNEPSPDIYQKIAEAQASNAPEQKIIQEAQDRAKAQIGGAGVGTAIAVKRAAPTAIRASARIMEEGRIAAQEAAAVRAAQASAQAAGGAGITPPVQGGLSVLDPNANQATRILQGTTGDEGTTGRARMTGFNTETSQASARQKEMSRLVEELQRRGAVADDAQAFFAKQPGMTSSPSGILLPRSETPTVGLGPRGPEGQIGYTRPPTPPPPPLSLGERTMTKATAGLDYVTDLFKGLMDSKVGKGVGTFMRYAGPPAAIAGAAGEGMNIAQELGKPNEQRDYGDMALSGLGAAAGLAALAPAAAVAIPAGLTAAGIGGYRYFRDRAAADRARQRMSGQPMR